MYTVKMLCTERGDKILPRRTRTPEKLNCMLFFEEEEEEAVAAARTAVMMD